jgi:hypothetical protein
MESFPSFRCPIFSHYMNSIERLIVAGLSIFGLASPALAGTPNEPPADAMREMRLRALASPASDYGIAATKAFSPVYGVLIDFPIDQVTATVLSLSDGTASLYTTSTFGVIGGGSHETVRAAAMRLVKSANQFFDEAKSTKDYPYPAKGKVRFYLVSFSGVKVIETDLSAIECDQSKYSSLFWLGQEVMTQLRLSTELK